MQKDWSTSFAVGGADREKPDPANWDLSLPTPNTLDPLLIETKENLDYGSTLAALSLTSSEDIRVKGYFTLQKEETAILFYPHLPWSSGPYTLTIQPSLEDTAGNRYHRLFDEDISEDRGFTPRGSSSSIVPLEIEFQLKN